MPNVVNSRDCSEKSGAAFGWGLSESAFNQLCLRNFYEYNVIPDDGQFNNGRKIYSYWCDEWVDPKDDVIYEYREMMSQYWDSSFDDYLLLYNEWSNPGQCNMTDEELVLETHWLIQNYPNAKFIVGNTYGYDHLKDYTVFRQQMDLLIEAGLTWDNVYGVAIHDYTEDYVEAIDGIRNVMDSYGERKPIFVTEFLGINDTLEQRIVYYENENDIEMWFYFAPCNPLEEYSLVYRTVTPVTLNCSEQLTELGYQFLNSTFGEQND